jgi:hypothetical protein
MKHGTSISGLTPRDEAMKEVYHYLKEVKLLIVANTGSHSAVVIN